MMKKKETPLEKLIEDMKEEDPDFEKILCTIAKKTKDSDREDEPLTK